jgi:putative flippase GtrA
VSPPAASLADRLFSRRAGGMLVRNTVASTAVFAISLGVLWLLVEVAGMDKVLAAAIGFLVAQTVHYVLGRSWVYRGTDRGVAAGYAIFLATAALGLGITLGLFAALLRYTAINYLFARVIVSVFAGLAMFAINATVNFRKV